MTQFLDTDAAVNTFRSASGLTSFADILARVFSPAPCDVCVAAGITTSGPTFFDRETGGNFCLGCLELACVPLPDLEDGQQPDPEIMAIAREVIEGRRAARTD